MTSYDTGSCPKAVKAFMGFLLLVGVGVALATPPPWAPAYGYRNKHQEYDYYEDEGGGVFYLPWLTRGYHNDFVTGGRCNREKLGAVIGILVGQSIGRHMDEIDQNCTGQTLEYAPDHAPVSWRDPDTGGAYRVTPVRTYPAPEGRYCREYQMDAIIGGRTQRVYGTACRQPDGSWQRM